MGKDGKGASWKHENNQEGAGEMVQWAEVLVTQNRWLEFDP